MFIPPVKLFLLFIICNKMPESKIHGDSAEVNVVRLAMQASLYSGLVYPAAKFTLLLAYVVVVSLPFFFSRKAFLAASAFCFTLQVLL